MFSDVPFHLEKISCTRDSFPPKGIRHNQINFYGRWALLRQDQGHITSYGPKLSNNKAKAISAELFELNLKVQLCNSVIV